MIIACIIAYNEERMLPGCLESVANQVDRMVVVDGAFVTFPLRNGSAASTDATEDIAAAYGAEWVRCLEDGDGNPIPWPTEMEKRTAYFLGEEGDWYLHIDADERLLGRLPEMVDGQHYMLQVNVNKRWILVPRLFQHRGWMRYEGSHNAVWSDERLIHLAGAIGVDPMRCRLVHLKHLRPAWYQLAVREHYARRAPTERIYREAHNI